MSLGLLSSLPLTVILFISFHHRHHASTLFPYTTLFRSSDPRDRRRRPRAPREQADGPHARPPHRGASRRVLFPGHRQRGRDRKSTRLNSSHSQISYAVFCLKKKTLERKNNRTAS